MHQRVSYGRVDDKSRDEWPKSDLAGRLSSFRCTWHIYECDTYSKSSRSGLKLDPDLTPSHKSRAEWPKSDLAGRLSSTPTPLVDAAVVGHRIGLTPTMASSDLCQSDPTNNNCQNQSTFNLSGCGRGLCISYPLNHPFLHPTFHLLGYLMSIKFPLCWVWTMVPSMTTSW